MTAKVWIVDDDSSIRWVLERTLGSEGFECESFADGEALLSSLEMRSPDVILSDIRMPGIDGLSLLEQIHRRQADLPIIIMTAHSDLDSAVNAYQRGAFEYLPKPFDIDEAVTLVRRAENHLKEQRTKRKARQQEATTTPEIIGEAPAMQEVFRAIGRLSRSSISVLINGQSGTGKELVAHALHKHSPRAHKNFIALNMAAIPKDLIESELFGHEKGAFTGAIAARRGRFELAQGGTLFLDEIGDMPLPMQVKLLRVLQERLFDRVGGGKPIQADVRIIAATHRDLEAMIRTQGFREDLYYRLNVFPIETPPLRERCDDIPLLLQELLNRHAEQHRGIIRLTQRAMESLMQYPWPGNVRELSNLIERLLILYPNQIIDVADLPGRYRLLPSEPRDERLTEMDERDALAAVFQTPPVLDPGLAAPLPMQLPQEGLNLKEMLADLEVELIRQALESQDGVVARAADLLSMRRTTLVAKRKQSGMSKDN